MNHNRMFLRCNICGNIIGMIHDAGVTPVCCGEEMELLTVNTTDASQEKHVPVARRNGDEIAVNIGDTDHPMTKEHHITWIAVADENQTCRISLEMAGRPKAAFCMKNGGSATVYAYCNLHGLWASEV